MENGFCFLKGVVDCSPGVVQNCNNMRVKTCPLEEADENEDGGKKQNFCFLKGLVDCSEGRVQECNNQHTKSCPKEQK